MHGLRRIGWGWLLAWLAGTLAGGGWLAWDEAQRQREAFDTDARIIHRLLSQRAVQHDAVLATLALQPHTPASDPALQRLGSVYPQITAVARHSAAEGWQPAVPAAVARDSVRAQSESARRAVLAEAALEQGHYWIVQAAGGQAHALRIDAAAMVPWADWPMPERGQGSAVRVLLRWQATQVVLQPGLQALPARGSALALGFAKTLAAESQPFEVVVQSRLDLRAMPWLVLAVWALAWAAVLAGARAWRAQRQARERAEALLRMDQIARLNTLGELAAGLAHELNQPLTAVLASTQAAERLLADEPADIHTAREAMRQAAAQSQRAAQVLARLRRSIERPSAAQDSAVVLAEAARRVVYLMEPEIARAGVRASVVAEGRAQALQVSADPVALEQIIHNLVANALQAMSGRAAPGRRELLLEISATAQAGVLRVSDSGPGVAAELRGRIFQPFVTTRADGLGLGLSLCESLAAGMGGRLALDDQASALGGAAFSLSLPLHTTGADAAARAAGGVA